MNNKEQVSVDNFDPNFEPFMNEVKKLAKMRVKYVEDYIKFWLAVNVENLEALTPGEYAKNYQLAEIEYLTEYGNKRTTWLMQKSDHVLLEKEDYWRLKRLDANVKNKIKEYSNIPEFSCPYISQKNKSSEILELLKNLYD